MTVLTRHPGVQACWLRARRYVLTRDGHRCRVCGVPATEVDHIWPRRLGGSDEPDNLRAICRSCNLRKGGNPIDGMLPLFTRAAVDPRAGRLIVRAQTNVDRWHGRLEELMRAPSWRDPDRWRRFHFAIRRRSFWAGVAAAYENRQAVHHRRLEWAATDPVVLDRIAAIVVTDRTTATVTR